MIKLGLKTSLQYIFEFQPYKSVLHTALRWCHGRGDSTYTQVKGGRNTTQPFPINNLKLWLEKQNCRGRSCILPVPLHYKTAIVKTIAKYGSIWKKRQKKKVKYSNKRWTWKWAGMQIVSLCLLWNFSCQETIYIDNYIEKKWSIDKQNFGYILYVDNWKLPCKFWNQ